MHSATKDFPTVPAGCGSSSSPDRHARSEESARVAKFRLPRTLELLLGRLPVHRESIDSVRARTAPPRRCFTAATRGTIRTKRRSCSKLGGAPRSFRESAPPTTLNYTSRAPIRVLVPTSAGSATSCLELLSPVGRPGLPRSASARSWERRNRPKGSEAQRM